MEEELVQRAKNATTREEAEAIMDDKWASPDAMEALVHNPNLEPDVKENAAKRYLETQDDENHVINIAVTVAMNKSKGKSVEELEAKEIEFLRKPRMRRYLEEILKRKDRGQEYTNAMKELLDYLSRHDVREFEDVAKEELSGTLERTAKDIEADVRAPEQQSEQEETL